MHRSSARELFGRAQMSAIEADAEAVRVAREADQVRRVGFEMLADRWAEIAEATRKSAEDRRIWLADFARATGLEN